MTSRRQGMTLIEIAVASLLSLLVFLLALTIVLRMRDVGSKASSSFVLGQDTALGFEILRRDFSETSLQSLRFEPMAGQAWVHMAGARDEAGKFLLSPHGVPDWNQRIAYALLADEDGDGISGLVRQVVPYSYAGGIPAPMLDKVSMSSPVHTVFTQVLAPGFEMARQGGSWKAVSNPNCPEGGFSLRFVRLAPDGSEQLSPIHPAQRSDAEEAGWSRGCTPTLEIHLTMVEFNKNTGHYTSVQLPIRVTPRH